MSPVRARSSSRSRSPVRRKMARPISPVRESRRWSSQSISPVRGSSPGRSRSPNRRRSMHRRRSPVRSKSPIQSRTGTRIRSPVSNKATVRARSPVRGKSTKQTRSPLRSLSPLEYSPSPRSKRVKRAQEERDFDRAKDRKNGISSIKDFERGRHKDKEIESSRDPHRSRSSVSRSPSPQTKRVKRTQEAKEFDRAREKEHGRSSIKDYDTGVHNERERDSNKDVERKGRKRIRSLSPKDGRNRQIHESDSPPRTSADVVPEKSKSSRGGDRDEVVDRSTMEMPESDDASNDVLAKMKATEEALKAKQSDKNKPSFELSGKLAAETNKVRGITLLFNEPPDARKPSQRWRLYVFKAGEALNDPLYIHRQTCYLFGRERRIADIPTDHPSCSKQHAVVQYRQVEKEEEDGTIIKQVRPYLMDLGSTNGTFLNDNRLEPQRYYELFEKDTIKFGNSSREYVILHENSAG